MKKTLSLALPLLLLTFAGFSQAGKYWSASYENPAAIVKHKAVSRLSFPAEFKLFKLDLDVLKQDLFKVTGNNTRHSIIISLPNAEAGLEEFEIFEASNFEPSLQAQFPDIRAFSGRGITDRSAMLKMSYSPSGIQTMVFRSEKENEFIEAYSQDQTIYAVFRSKRTPGQLPWRCNTADSELANGLNSQVSHLQTVESSAGQLKTMRLAQSVTAEYSNYFGATSAAQVNLVLAAINATLTRCNGVYEKDLAVHLNLIANTTSVFYYNASTDPYSNASSGAGGAWNNELQNTLTAVIGEANYDIGHLFGASGGGGSAGCIGCVCTNGSKGKGFTSPADATPQGDNFDIDYVVHEVGHQLGANHTYSFQNEGTGVQKEVGSGITIMGYAGITSYDVAPHSLDIFHEASIAQVQSNLSTKTCPVTTTLGANNATPVVAGVSNYIIPKSTPFALTGAATDANAADVLTYCWEQNDNTTSFGSNSVASAGKTTGPNWISFAPSTSPTRYFPKLATILAGGLISGPLPGGDANANTEALSSVARTLNFRLTVRDNCPYSSTAPVKVGQTAFTDMVVTVNAVSGPFAVSVPNTSVSWAGNSTQTITWAVAGTTAAPVSCANVKISLSTDGGQTFPTVLAASTANDGTEALVIPNSPSTTARIKIEAVGNIFFDISNTNFTITAAAAGLTNITTGNITPTTYCAGSGVNVPFTINASANAGNVFTAQLSNSAGSFASPVSIGILNATTAGTIAATIPAGTSAGTGYRIRVVSSAPVVTGTPNTTNLAVNTVPVTPVITAGGPTTFCSGGSVLLSGNNNGGTWNTGSTATTLTVTAGGSYFVTNSNSCGSIESNHISVTVTPTLTPSVTISANPAGAVCGGTPVTFTATPVNGGNPPSFNWFVNGVTVSGGSQPGLNAITLSNLANNSAVSCTMAVNPNAGSCVTPAVVTSNTITVSVNPVPVAAVTPAGPTTICAGGSVVLNASTGTGFSFQWRSGGANMPGATTSSITVNSSGSYDVVITNLSGCKDTSSPVAVTVNPLPNVSFSGLAGSYTVNAAPVSLAGSPAGGTFSGPGISGNNFSPSVAGVGGPYSIVYTYTNANGCTNTSTNQTTVTASCSVPGIPGTILAGGGNTKVCPGDSKVYTVSAVTGAITYTWTPPPGSVISSGQGTRTVTVVFNAGFQGDSLRVTANNSCGSSVAKALKINRNTPLTPGGISAPSNGTKACPGDVKSYSIAAVTGATSYTWTAAPGSVVSSGQGTTAITVTYNAGFLGDSLRVVANNACGSGAARALKINRSLPVAPGAITGATAAVCNSSGVPYSVAAIAGINNNWSWDVPGATIASGQGTNAITTNFAGGFISGKLSVTASNGCGTSTARVLTVYARPATPGPITGSTGVCANQSGVPYSIAAIPSATSYTWYGPTGSRISDQTTTSTGSSLTTTSTNVTVNFGTLAGSVRVKANNACASGGLASLTVNIVCKKLDAQQSIAAGNNDVMVYPNPSNGNFRIVLETVKTLSTVKVEIMNEFGQVQYRAIEKSNNGIINMELAGRLTDGIYMVCCTVNGVRTIKKLVISK